METATNYHDAVRASGEEWPGPRLVELRRLFDDGFPDNPASRSAAASHRHGM